MITVIVSAIKGPILSVVSGCLGESGMLRLWLWNLVPTQANMPGSDVSWELPYFLQEACLSPVRIAPFSLILHCNLHVYI